MLAEYKVSTCLNDFSSIQLSAIETESENSTGEWNMRIVYIAKEIEK